SSRRRHTRFSRDWSSDVCSSDLVEVASWLQEDGVDLVDVSSGGNVPATIPVGPGYQVKFAAAVRERTGLPVAAVGLITDPVQAEHILATGQADVVLVGRESLRDPHFPLRAAQVLGVEAPPVPGAYERGYGINAATGRRGPGRA